MSELVRFDRRVDTGAQWHAMVTHEFGTTPLRDLVAQRLAPLRADLTPGLLTLLIEELSGVCHERGDYDVALRRWASFAPALTTVHDVRKYIAHYTDLPGWLTIDLALLAGRLTRLAGTSLSAELRAEVEDAYAVVWLCMVRHSTLAS